VYNIGEVVTKFKSLFEDKTQYRCECNRKLNELLTQDEFTTLNFL